MEVLFLLFCLLFAFIWYDGLRARERANLAGMQVCIESQVQFLDGSVQLQKRALRRDNHGQLNIWRLYHFDFSSDGEVRYQGRIELLGQNVLSIYMAPYREV